MISKMCISFLYCFFSFLLTNTTYQISKYDSFGLLHKFWNMSLSKSICLEFCEINIHLFGHIHQIPIKSVYFITFFRLVIVINICKLLYMSHKRVIICIVFFLYFLMFIINPSRSNSFCWLRDCILKWLIQLLASCKPLDLFGKDNIISKYEN